MWSSYVGCIRVIKNSWDTNFAGCSMYILDRKLRLRKENLKIWNKHTFGNVDSKVTEDESALKEIQSDIDRISYNNLTLAKEVKA